ncbi:MAG: GntR family transcriptional regulator [Asticcacaulis sp.]
MKATSTAAALADTLRGEINRGRWKHGQVLRQEDLAEEYRVSRLPVREALALLQAEGLVNIETHRGARIASLAADDIREIFSLRILLEGEALRAATPCHTAKSLRILTRWQDDLEAEDEPVAWIATDRAFHEALYEPAGKGAPVGPDPPVAHPHRTLWPGRPVARQAPRRLGPANTARYLKPSPKKTPAGLFKILANHLRETEIAILAALET